MPGIIADPVTVETKAGIIEYSLTGSNGPVVMVVHGGLGGYDQARVMAARWINENNFRILCPSRPGYLGTPLESGRSMEEQADLFASLLDHLGIEKVVVVSASAGGPPGYVFAMRHPERVSAMIAIDSVSGCTTFRKGRPGNRSALSQQLWSKANKHDGKDQPGFIPEAVVRYRGVLHQGADENAYRLCPQYAIRP